MGLPRDYIMSFIVEPGRIVSPAAVDEVAKSKIGPDVAPAAVEVVEIYVRERIAAVRAIGGARYLGPVSPWRVQQVLTWSRPDQRSLLPAEGYETDFKAIFETTDDKKFRYLRSLAAYANFRGGYILFGVDDAGRALAFDHQRFLDYDWDHFDQIIESTFQPYFSWEKAVVELPEGEGIRLDTEIVKSLARAAGKGPEDYRWLIDGGHIKEPRRIGVLYAYPSNGEWIECVRDRGGVLKKGLLYRRMRARNQGFDRKGFLQRFGSHRPNDSLSASLEKYRLEQFAAKTAAGALGDLDPETIDLFEDC